MSARLTAWLDVLLPGGDGFPSASAAGAADWLSNEPRVERGVAVLLEKLPDGFEDLGADGQVEALAEIGARAPACFNAAVVAAYSAYYTRPSVLQVIEDACGYKAGPPQPGGYELPPFDDGILEIPRSREPSWVDPSSEVKT